MMIRHAEQKDIDKICKIIEEAKELLKSRGINQWQNGYPNRETVIDDIKKNIGYVVQDEDVIAYCVIVFGEDCNYQQIDGKWLNKSPYAAVHRVCVSSRCRGQGTAGKLFQYAQKLCRSKKIYDLRVDTHPQNLSMQRAIQKFGFIYCGQIFLQSPEEFGAPRYAYQKNFSE